MAKKTKKAAAESRRSDTEILKELIGEILEYNSLRDDEWDFNDEHGSPDMWDDVVCEEHDELLGEIQSHRKAIRDLIVEATGDENLAF